MGNVWGECTENTRRMQMEKRRKKKKKLLVLKKEDWVKKRITGFLKKLNTELAYDPEIPLQIYIQKKWNICPHRNWTWMFIAVLFTTAQRYKQRKCPWADEWINKWWSTHPMGCYSATKRRNMNRAATWMNFNATWSLKGMGGCLGDETVLKPEMVAAFHERIKIALSCYTLKPLLYAMWISPQ